MDKHADKYINIKGPTHNDYKRVKIYNCKDLNSRSPNMILY